ncbi:hypothetical protein ORIO_23100 (plasmid) [Cereibacter azotoformans]|uniref:Transposase n=1 Tax=Cereibacter azotoformans TaxID=43057 RepID=A0A2T5JUR3_9RHOB|nr:MULTISPECIES: hypothetical protein [Cereibacter]AXQ96270.1 hypothetical protein D0Z66_21465 [Cereibacter sphaeroides]PTR13892.1 hypothetical protein C8J28_11957 [Cereibacter azotoformans]UIJ33172.1 hypothetical protein LV780_21340 [Cereibacter azotoformans]ULB12653.1 hypothetical protein ORIO_23100 [Cereibacter azotoformans]
MDVHIGSVETQVTATDPKLLDDPRFIARIVRLVKEELARDDLEKGRRERDRSPTPPPGR